jgi:cytochrome b561
MLRFAATLAVAALISAPAMAEDWRLDQQASTVEFETTVFGGTTSGEFDDFDADIRLDPANLENARIEAVVRTASGAMGNNDYQSALIGGQGLAPGDHPEARFVSEDIRAVETGYEAHGTLTIKGVETEIVLPFTLEVNGDRAVADGRFVVDRNTFGVGGSGWGDVGAEVEVILHIEADRAEQT